MTSAPRGKTLPAWRIPLSTRARAAPGGYCGTASASAATAATKHSSGGFTSPAPT